MYQIGDAEAKEIVDEKAEEIRKVVTCYIDEQKATFLKTRDSFNQKSKEEKAICNELINLPKGCRIKKEKL